MPSVRFQLLQLRVLRFGFFQDGDVRISVFPGGEEVLVCGFRFCGVACEYVGASKLQMHQRTDGFVDRGFSRTPEQKDALLNPLRASLRSWTLSTIPLRVAFASRFR